MWTTDHTWTTTETITASHLNVSIRALEVSESEVIVQDEGPAAMREDDNGSQ